MRKGKFILLFSALMCAAFGIILFLYADSLFTSKKEIKNVENSKRLHIGMSEKEVLKIMGEADDVSIKPPLKFGNKRLFFQPPFGASQGIKVYLDTIDDKVVRIIPYE